MGLCATPHSFLRSLLPLCPRSHHTDSYHFVWSGLVLCRHILWAHSPSQSGSEFPSFPASRLAQRFKLLCGGIFPTASLWDLQVLPPWLVNWLPDQDQVQNHQTLRRGGDSLSFWETFFSNASDKFETFSVFEEPHSCTASHKQFLWVREGDGLAPLPPKVFFSPLFFISGGVPPRSVVFDHYFLFQGGAPWGVWSSTTFFISGGVPPRGVVFDHFFSCFLR